MKKGFTLIELLVVIAIIAILVALTTCCHSRYTLTVNRNSKRLITPSSYRTTVAGISIWITSRWGSAATTPGANGFIRNSAFLPEHTAGLSR